MEIQQAFAAFTTAIVVCVLGVPIWWHTTTTYRADLPYHELFSLRDGGIPKIETKWEILFDQEILSHKSADMKEELLELIKMEAKRTLVGFDTEVTMTNITSPLHVKELVNSFSDLPLQAYELENALFSFIPKNKEVNFVNDLQFRIFFIKKSRGFSNAPGKCKILVGKSNIIIFIGDNTMQYLTNCTAHLVNAFGNIVYPNMTALPSNDLSKVNHKTTQTAAGYQISFTLANSNPHEKIVEWEIQHAVRSQLLPFLDQVSFLGPFSMSSQVLNFVDVVLAPKHSNDEYYYSMKQLPLLINPLESRLNTYTSNYPILNFVLYIPPCYQMPLTIKSKKQKETSFISSRWGGVVFKDISSNNCSLSNKVARHKLDVREDMLIFISQLRELIGLKRQEDNDVIFSTFDPSYINQWEVCYLLLDRTYENLEKSISTLTSLAKLLDQIANIVIRDDIKELIVKALNEVKRSKILLKNGHIRKAYHASRSAFNFSEQAFFDHSLLALLYFPDDQKYAIYLPLFLPISLPILISLVSAIKSLKAFYMKPKTE